MAPAYYDIDKVTRRVIEEFFMNGIIQTHFCTGLHKYNPNGERMTELFRDEDTEAMEPANEGRHKSFSKQLKEFERDHLKDGEFDDVFVAILLAAYGTNYSIREIEANYENLEALGKPCHFTKHAKDRIENLDKDVARHCAIVRKREEAEK